MNEDQAVEMPADMPPPPFLAEEQMSQELRKSSKKKKKRKSEVEKSEKKKKKDKKKKSKERNESEEDNFMVAGGDAGNIDFFPGPPTIAGIAGSSPVGVPEKTDVVQYFPEASAQKRPPRSVEESMKIMRERSARKREEVREQQQSSSHNADRPAAAVAASSSVLPRSSPGLHQNRYAHTARSGAVPLSAGSPRKNGMSSSEGQDETKIGAVAVAGAAPIGKQSAPGATAVRGPAPRGKTAAPSGITVGAVAAAGAAPRGKPTAGGLSIGAGAETNETVRPGALSVSSAAPQGKGSAPLRDSRVGATPVASAAPQGKGSAPLRDSRVGATAVASAAPQGKGSAPLRDSRVGATPVASAAPQGEQSPPPDSRVAAAAIGAPVGATVGAVAVAEAAPKGKTTGISVSSSAESYETSITRPGAMSMTSMAPQGKRSPYSSGSTRSREELQRVGAQSVPRAASRDKNIKPGGPSLAEGAETHTAAWGSQSQIASEGSQPNQKDRVSYFPSSDLYASLSSVNSGEGVDNKVRISQFPGEENYEIDLDTPTKSRVIMKRTTEGSPVGTGGAFYTDKSGPQYSIGGESYDGNDARTDGLQREGSRSSMSQNSDMRNPTGAYYISRGTVEVRDRNNPIATSQQSLVPDPESNVMLADVTPSVPHDTNNGELSTRNKFVSFYRSTPFILSLTLLVLAGGAVAAVLVLVVFNNDSGSSPGASEVPTPSPILPLDPVREAEIRSIIVNVTDPETLNDPTSPQNAAYNWIVREDQLSSTEDPSRVIARYSLASFFYSTGGEDWSSSQEWLSAGLLECEWEYISCDIYTKITKIDTSKRETGANLVGTIPSEIRELKTLVDLIVPANKIAEIHSDIGFLPVLETLNAQGNSFEGTLPEFLFNLTSLQSLDLGGNSFTGEIPMSISRLSNLVNLFLDQNQLTGTITSQLVALSSLHVLHLSTNAVEGVLLNIIDGLENLHFVLMDNNKVTGQLDGQRLMAFQQLQDMAVGFNSLSGTIPSEIGSMPSLKRFLVDGNRLTGTIPTEMARTSTLEVIYLEYNRLEGSVPDVLCSVPTITELSVGCSVPCTCEFCICDAGNSV